MDTNDEFNKAMAQLFGAVRAFVLLSGGDGGATIVSGRHKKRADEFEDYERGNGNHFIVREDYDNIVIFHNDHYEEEYIAFTGDPDYESPFEEEIVVKLGYGW